jgi:hypothetical protein
MRFLRPDCFWRALPRRCAAALTLACYLLTALNVPLPVPAANRTPGGGAYPCQDHGCGCQSAAQCWTGCCCLTPEQRWTWARDHRVVPPPDAEKPTGASWNTKRQRDRDTAPPSCCDQHASPESPRPGACCAKADDAKQEKPQGKQIAWRLTLAGLKCQGQSTLWVTSGAAVPPAPALTWQPYFEPLDLMSWADDAPRDCRAAPQDPPPRFAHV